MGGINLSPTEFKRNKEITANGRKGTEDSIKPRRFLNFSKTKVRTVSCRQGRQIHFQRAPAQRTSRQWDIIRLLVPLAKLGHQITSDIVLMKSGSSTTMYSRRLHCTSTYERLKKAYQPKIDVLEWAFSHIAAELGIERKIFWNCCWFFAQGRREEVLIRMKQNPHFSFHPQLASALSPPFSF